MKVVVEEVRKFICVMKTKFLFSDNFPFQSQQAALVVFQTVRHLVLSGAMSEEALITRYFGTIESC